MTHKTFFNICFVLLALLFPLTMQAQPKNLLDCRVLLFPHGEIEEGKAFAEECMSEHGYPKFAEEDNIMIAGYYTFPMGQRILSDYNIKKAFGLLNQSIMVIILEMKIMVICHIRNMVMGHMLGLELIMR